MSRFNQYCTGTKDLALEVMMTTSSSSMPFSDGDGRVRGIMERDDGKAGLLVKIWLSSPFVGVDKLSFMPN